MNAISSSLLVNPDFNRDEYIAISPTSAGWEHLSFAARQMAQGQQWAWETGENELAIVVLGGTCRVQSDQGEWAQVGRRRSVFDGMPYALYLPRRTHFTLTATSERLDIAYGWAAAFDDYPARLVTPAEVQDRDPRRGKRDPPDQQNAASRVSLQPAGGGGGVYALRQLELLPAPQA